MWIHDGGRYYAGRIEPAARPNGRNPVGVKVLGVFKAATDLRSYASGEVIFEAGSQGQEMFGVAEGMVELRFPDGHVSQVGPDETFGELAIIDSTHGPPRRWPSRPPSWP